MERPFTWSPRSAVRDHESRGAARSSSRADRTGRRERIARRGGAPQGVSHAAREELALIERDVNLAPNNAALHYRYGLLLYLHGKLAEAEKSLVRACELEPNVPDFLLALVLYYQKQQRHQEATELARKLVKMRPDDASYRNLLEDLQRTTTRESE